MSNTILSKILVVGLLLIIACTKPPDYPVTPQIEFIGLSKNTVLQNTTGDLGTFDVSISFQDGDGDIGFENAVEEKDLILTDLRDNTSFQSVTMVPIPEAGAENGISGEIILTITTGNGNICCNYPPELGIDACATSQIYPIDTLVFEIQLKDRAGHISNAVATDPIYILCQ